MNTKARRIATLAWIGCVFLGARIPYTTTSGNTGEPARLTITYPLDGTLFPPGIPAPTFLWEDKAPHVEKWRVTIHLDPAGQAVRVLTAQPTWRPEKSHWERIQRRSMDRDVTVSVEGLERPYPHRALSKGAVTIRTSPDPVTGLIFYREVPLPFKYAREHLAAIRWRLADITSEEPPPVVLEKLPMCGNCHSFSADGQILGMDVDALNDKSSYVVTPIKTETVIDMKDIITWSDTQGGDPTYGLLSQVSPDGRYVLSMTRDNVFVEDRDGNLAYSQLFFPIKGILQIYDRQTKKFWPLRGADDPDTVHANPNWSPDGRYIVFARSKAIHVEESGFHLLTTYDETRARIFKTRFLEGKRAFQFDLYRIPFSGGEGGRAEPIPGASANGMSNYFPRFSPDGKWIVFTQAKSFMLLQPDSQLFIMPAEGGAPRRMNCNTSAMNSWHSWSPDGKWLVFSSKLRGPYTQLYLTHVDEDGKDTPPVLLESVLQPHRAANIPEFVNLRPGQWAKVLPRFLESESLHSRKGELRLLSGDVQGALEELEKAIEQDPGDFKAYLLRGHARASLGDTERAVRDYSRAIELNADDFRIYFSRGSAWAKLGDYQRAVEDFDRVIELNPRSNAAYNRRGIARFQLGDLRGALADNEMAIRLNPDDPVPYVNRADVKLRLNDAAGAFEDFRRAIRIKPDDFIAYSKLGDAQLKSKDMPGAIESFTKSIELNPQFAASYLKRGMIRLQLGETPTGCEDLRKANELDSRIGRKELEKHCRQ